ncbi:MAG: APC family permease [Methanomassiliicoccales archaeon]
MSENQECNTSLHRCITWKQGFLIGIGIPLTIVPTIGITSYELWGASIILWIMSVVQGFLQNMAFAEMSTAFPNHSGIPGFTQAVFRSKDSDKHKYDKGKFLGGFCAWAYWFVWAPGLAVFIVLIGFYLQSISPALAGIDITVLNLSLGLVILGGLAFLSSRGLQYSAKLGLVVAVSTIIPIVIIVLAPFLTGNFHAEYITSAWAPPDWAWDGDHIMLILGLMVLAQWSACCWEVVTVYGPEYKKPSSDLPKVLLACGLFCLALFALIQTSVIGTLGMDAVLNNFYTNPNWPLLQPVAEIAFGSLGATIVILMLIGAMILLIQIGFTAAARAMHSMALEDNLPRFFAKTNRKGEPMRAIYVIAIINLALILMGSPVAILAASAIAYVFAFALGLFAYVKAKRDVDLKKVDRPYKAPRGYLWVAMALGIMQLPFLLIGAIYINNLAYGLAPTVVGLGVLTIFIPIWIYTQHAKHKRDQKEVEIEPKAN